MKKKILFLGVGMFSLLGTCRADQSFTLTMQSDRSEYIGGGTMHTFSSNNEDALTIKKATKSEISLKVEGLEETFLLDFGVPKSFQEETIVPGKRFGFRGTLPGLEISGNGKGCNELIGKFYIHEYILNGTGEIETLAIDFVQYCERDTTKGLYGSLRYNSSIAGSCTSSDCSKVKSALGVPSSISATPSQESSSQNSSSQSSGNSSSKKISSIQKGNNTIFQINAYAYNTELDIYTPMQYGSAVLVGKNLLLTNAHVITDEDDKLTLHYEACQTVSPELPAECFSTLKLIKYDIKNDLALLEIQGDLPVEVDPVSFGETELSIGTKIKILGYPGNGGNTITETIGNIAGYQKGAYKTDANLDEGNSGGGAFDEQGNFIGVPTYVVGGITSMGYIVSLDVINPFLEITKSINKSVTAGFTQYLKGTYSIERKGSIENNIFTTPQFEEGGLYLTLAQAKPNQGVYTYTIEDEDGNMIVITVGRTSKYAQIGKIIESQRKELADGLGDPKKVTQTQQNMGGYSWKILTVQYDEVDMLRQEYYLATIVDGTFINISMIVAAEDTTRKQELESWIKKIVFKKKFPKQSGKIEYSHINIQGSKSRGIVKFLGSDKLHVLLISNDSNWSMSISPTSTLESIEDIEDAVDYMKEIGKSSGEKVESQKDGNRYAVIITKEDGTKEITTLQGAKRGGKFVGIQTTSKVPNVGDVKKVLEISKKLLKTS